MDTGSGDRLITEREAAGTLGYSIKTLQDWRHRPEKYPRMPRLPFVRIGRAVRYLQSDVSKALAELVARGSTTSTDTAA